MIAQNTVSSRQAAGRGLDNHDVAQIVVNLENALYWYMKY